MVITGDVTQIDLPNGKSSGLEHAATVLKEVERRGNNVPYGQRRRQKPPRYADSEGVRQGRQEEVNKCRR